jgi:hypothetical protein
MKEGRLASSRGSRLFLINNKRDSSLKIILQKNNTHFNKRTFDYFIESKLI